MIPLSHWDELGSGCVIHLHPMTDEVSRKPHPAGEVKGHNKNRVTFLGSPALWAGSFKYLSPEDLHGRRSFLLGGLEPHTWGW